MPPRTTHSLPRRPLRGAVAAALGAGVARIDPDFRNVTGARGIQCGLAALDVQRARLQAAIGAQTDPDIVVDDGGEGPGDRRGLGWVRLGRGAGQDGEQAQQSERHAGNHANCPRIRTAGSEPPCFRLFSV